MDRHDYSYEARALLNHAVAIDLLDGVELGCVMLEHGGDLAKVLETLQGYAWALCHSDPETRRAWNKAREEYDQAQHQRDWTQARPWLQAPKGA